MTMRRGPSRLPGGAAVLASARSSALASVAAVAVLPALAGCPPKEAPQALGAGSIDWPFRPARVAIHPLTRADSAGADRSLLVMVEFRDQDGDPVKAIGMLEVEVRCAAAAPTDASFRFDLAEAALNRRLYDPVTQTYRIRLESPWSRPPSPGSTVSIEAMLEVSPQERISGEVRVPW